MHFPLGSGITAWLASQCSTLIWRRDAKTFQSDPLGRDLSCYSTPSWKDSKEAVGGLCLKLWNLRDLAVMQLFFNGLPCLSWMLVIQRFKKSSCLKELIVHWGDSHTKEIISVYSDKCEDRYYEQLAAPPGRRKHLNQLATLGAASQSWQSLKGFFREK